MMALKVGGGNGSLKNLETQKLVMTVMEKDLMKKHYVLRLIT